MAPFPCATHLGTIVDLDPVANATFESSAVVRLRLLAAGRTDVGRQRGHNEDRLLVDTDLDLYVVADGMGGHNAGEVASALGAASILDFFQATVGTGVSGPFGENPANLPPEALRLVASIRKANADIFEISSTVEKHRGMGSTVVAAHVDRDARRMHVAHVGDSRCYRIREGAIEQLTRDHSLISDALAWNPQLTEEQLAILPKNVISRSLGRKGLVEVDIRSEDVLPGDLYLLCSDGLSGHVSDQQMRESLGLTGDLEESCDLMIALANDAGGSDNITVVIVRIDAESEPSALSFAPDIKAAPMATEEMAALLTAPDEIAELLALSDQPSSGVVPAAAPSTGVPCAACGKEILVGNEFCVECGARV